MADLAVEELRREVWFLVRSSPRAFKSRSSRRLGSWKVSSLLRDGSPRDFIFICKDSGQQVWSSSWTPRVLEGQWG